MKPPLRRTLAAALAFVIALGGAAHADTRSEVDAATKRLAELERRVTRLQDELSSMTSQLRDLSGDVDERRADAATVQRRLNETRAQIEATRIQHEAVRARLRTRARAVYVHGPASTLDLLLGATSLDDLAQRMFVFSKLIRQDANLSFEVRRLSADLELRKAEETRLLSEKAAAVKAARRRENALDQVFRRQQSGLKELVGARAELVGLVATLKDKLKDEQLASAVRAAGRGTPISFGAWGEALLRRLGAPVVRENLVVMVTWQASEYTQATWNPLATTMPAGGATVFNSHGVRNYESLEQGLDATIRTLRRPGHGYEAIVSGLQAGADAMATARAINASNWCRGCAGGAYVTGLVPTVEANYEKYAAA